MNGDASRRAVIAVVAGALAASACAGASCPPVAPVAEAAPAAGPRDQLSLRVRDYEAEVCACKALPCVTAAQAELSAWIEAHGELVDRALAHPLRSVELEGHLARVDACKAPLEATASAEALEAASPPGGLEGADAAIAQMAAIGDAVCRCKDQACLDHAMKRMARLREPAGKPTRAQMERAMKIAERMADCQKRILMGTP